MGFPSLIIIIILLLLLLLQLSDGEPDEASADQSIAAIIEEPFLKEGGQGVSELHQTCRSCVNVGEETGNRNKYIHKAGLPSTRFQNDTTQFVSQCGKLRTSQLRLGREHTFPENGCKPASCPCASARSPIQPIVPFKIQTEKQRNNGDLVSVLRGRSAPKRSLSYADVTLRASTGKKKGGIVGRALKKKKKSQLQPLTKMYIKTSRG